MDYRTAITWLDSTINLEGHSVAGERSAAAVALPIAGATDGLSLTPMRELLALLGDPHEAYRAIHITGTNGKGSTARMVAAILSETGLSVGLYTSPNLERINERIVWDGQWIPDDDLARVLTLIRDVLPMMEQQPSRFELLTAAALVWFAEVGAEVAVVEVGMLGRYDATNVVDGDVAVITNISKDHTDGVGAWREAIASEKAGIIKPASRVVVGPIDDDLMTIIDKEERESLWRVGHDVVIDRNELGLGGRVVSLETPVGSHEDLFLPVFGEHQGENLAVAVAAVDALFDRSLEHEVVEAALAELDLPGRFEVVSREPTVVLDGGHNPDGAAVAKQTLDESFARLGSWILVFGMLGGKDPGEMLDAIGADDFDAVIVTQPSWSRALPAAELAAVAEARGLPVEVVQDPVEAFRRARAVASDEDLVLVGGSMYVVGEVRSAARSLAEHRSFQDDDVLDD